MQESGGEILQSGNFAWILFTKMGGTFLDIKEEIKDTLKMHSPVPIHL